MKTKHEVIKDLNKAGGKGEVFIEKIISENEMGKSAAMFAKVTLPAGSSIGKHQHIRTTETYHILEGKAKYTDNDETYEVNAGETTFCDDGDFHAIENVGDTDLVFMALILNR